MMVYITRQSLDPGLTCQSFDIRLSDAIDGIHFPLSMADSTTLTKTPLPLTSARCWVWGRVCFDRCCFGHFTPFHSFLCSYEIVNCKFEPKLQLGEMYDWVCSFRSLSECICTRRCLFYCCVDKVGNSGIGWFNYSNQKLQQELGQRK